MSSEAALPEKEVLNRQLSCLLVGEQEQLSVVLGVTLIMSIFPAISPLQSVQTVKEIMI